MKIEKINDNQIRCTLTRDDLAQRQLKLSELAYGSEKAKSLFREMMQQAASEFGFESDNLPLMIEAIPTAGDSIVLNITKVDDPDELDTRFSRFTPTPADEAADKHKSVLEHLKKLDGAEDFLELYPSSRRTRKHLPILRSRNRLLLQKPKKQLLLNLLFHRSGFSLSQDLTV